MIQIQIEIETIGHLDRRLGLRNPEVNYMITCPVFSVL